MRVRELCSSEYFGYVNSKSQDGPENLHSFELANTDKALQDLSAAGPCSCPCGGDGGDQLSSN